MCCSTKNTVLRSEKYTPEKLQNVKKYLQNENTDKYQCTTLRQNEQPLNDLHINYVRNNPINRNKNLRLINISLFFFFLVSHVQCKTIYIYFDIVILKVQDLLWIEINCYACCRQCLFYATVSIYITKPVCNETGQKKMFF